MIILSNPHSGSRIVEIRSQSSDIKEERSKCGTENSVSPTEVDTHINRKMEFMYCIPDLEVFIDKTIKKCLLEYDLDANDTEAVLDDMEKAWPKSPLRAAEKPLLKDCNDNTENATNSRPASIPSQHQEAPLLDTALDGVHKERKVDPPTERFGKSRQSVLKTEAGLSDKAELVDVVANGNKDHEHVTTEGCRSDTSSPDVGDRKLHTTKHPKLKSILQQRYFEGQENSNNRKDPPGKKEGDKQEQHWDTIKHMSSNLDLLASAANIHTKSANATEEHKMQAIRRLQEESEREYQLSMGKQPHDRVDGKQLHDRVDGKQLHDRVDGKSTLPDTYRTMPVLLKLMSVPSSSKGPEFSRGGSPMSAIPVLHYNSLKVPSTDTSQITSSRTTFHEDVRVTSTTAQPEKYATSCFSRDRAQYLLHHYQNGYNAVIPQDNMVVTRQCSPSLDERDLRHGRQQVLPSLGSSLSWDGTASRDKPSSRYSSLASSSHYQHRHDNQHHHNQSDNLLQQFQYHGSRIANIIAEELQKDDGNDHNLQFQQSYHSNDRITSTDVKPSVDESRLAKTTLPGQYKKVTPKETVTFTSRVSPTQKQTVTQDKLATSADKPPLGYHAMSQLLPARLIMTNTHPSFGHSASDVDHPTSVRNNDINTFISTTPTTTHTINNVAVINSTNHTTSMRSKDFANISGTNHITSMRNSNIADINSSTYTTLLINNGFANMSSASATTPVRSANVANISDATSATSARGFSVANINSAIPATSLRGSTVATINGATPSTSLRSTDVANMTSITCDDNQPQDLSTKSRKMTGEVGEHGTQRMKSLTPALTTVEFSRPSISPSSIVHSTSCLESPSRSQPSSPSNFSNHKFHHTTASKDSMQMAALEKGDNRSTGPHFYISVTREPNSPNINAKRSSDSTKDVSEAGEVDMQKRRRLE